MKKISLDSFTIVKQRPKNLLVKSVNYINIIILDMFIPEFPPFGCLFLFEFLAKKKKAFNYK